MRLSARSSSHLLALLVVPLFLSAPLASCGDAPVDEVSGPADAGLASA